MVLVAVINKDPNKKDTTKKQKGREDIIEWVKLFLPTKYFGDNYRKDWMEGKSGRMGQPP
jgi:hypothetical protein